MLSELAGRIVSNSETGFREISSKLTSGPRCLLELVDWNSARILCRTTRTGGRSTRGCVPEDEPRERGNAKKVKICDPIQSYTSGELLMFELLRLLVDTVAKLAPTLSARKEKRELNAVGVELFLLYSALADVWLTGKKILGELNRAEQWMARKIAAGEQDREFGTHIFELLMLQRYSLQEVIVALRKLEFEMRAGRKRTLAVWVGSCS